MFGNTFPLLILLLMLFTIDCKLVTWINLKSTSTKSSVININMAARTFISLISRSQITFLFKYGKILMTSNWQCKYLQPHLVKRLSLQGKQHYQMSLFKLSVDNMSNYIRKIVQQYIPYLNYTVLTVLIVLL